MSTLNKKAQSILSGHSRDWMVDVHITGASELYVHYKCQPPAKHPRRHTQSFTSYLGFL